MKCVVCGLEADKISRANWNWDWFTGTLPETVHFCPKHKNSQKRDELWEKSRQPVSVEIALGRLETKP